MKTTTLIAIVLCLLTLPAAAQSVTPVQPINYDGACEIWDVNAFTGAGWAFASMDFSCHGTFMGNMTDVISIESPNAQYGSNWSTGIYASRAETWPVYGYQCYYPYGCFQVVQQPVPQQWHTSTIAYGQTNFRGHGQLSWVTGPATCYWWACWTPTDGRDMYSGGGGTVSPNDPAPPASAY